jgi:hypothetical protein
MLRRRRGNSGQEITQRLRHPNWIEPTTSRMRSLRDMMQRLRLPGPIGFIVAGIDIGSCIRAIFPHMRFVDLSPGISVGSVSSFTRQRKKMRIDLEH